MAWRKYTIREAFSWNYGFSHTVFVFPLLHEYTIQYTIPVIVEEME